MSLRQTKSIVAALQSEINSQIGLVLSYQDNTRENMSIVVTELDGSSRGYDQRMVASIKATQRALDSTLTELRQASQALNQIRAL